MKARQLSLAVIVLALCGALALTGIALAAAAKTKVTIEGGGGEYFGYVKSSKQKCKNNRKVKLYKQLGSTPQPRTDRFINSDIAQPNNDGYQWNTGSTGVKRGKVYARAGKIPGCKAGLSKTIQAS